MAKSSISLRVSFESKIYREIEISGEASLYKLAQVINKVFGFDFDHAFGFYDNLKDPYRSKEFYELFTDMGEDPNEGALPVKTSKVDVVFTKEGKRMAFLFDYGDEWIFEVKRIGGSERDVPKSFWKLLTSAGDAPEQYPAHEEDDDDRPFEEKYEMVKVGDLTVMKRREPK
jgi:hypothetical protein